MEVRKIVMVSAGILFAVMAAASVMAFVAPNADGPLVQTNRPFGT